MLITPTRHFLFYTLCNVLPGVLSSVIQTPDNILKYQRSQVFLFPSDMPCVFATRPWLLLVGRWAAAEEVSMGVCQQCSSRALHLHPAWPEGRALLLVALHLGRHFSEKNLRWNTYSGSCVLALLKFHILSSWCYLFSLGFLFPVTCLYAQEGLSERVWPLLRNKKRKNKPNWSAKICWGSVSLILMLLES